MLQAIIVGHVDSGKTSLVAGITKHAPKSDHSVSSLDRLPESQARGITIDLGFSSVEVEVDQKDAQGNPLPAPRRVPICLIDAPGHEALIKTVVFGAQLAASRAQCLALLVVDVQKGIQRQTVECLVLARFFCAQLIVVLNKCDTLAEATRDKKLQIMKSKLQQALERQLGFDSRRIRMVETSFDLRNSIETAASSLRVLSALSEACRAAHGGYGETEEESYDSLNTAGQAMANQSSTSSTERLLLGVDHAFPVKGHGWVLTGCVLAGRVAIGDRLHPLGLPSSNYGGRVRSMETFHEKIDVATKGDRLAAAITGIGEQLPHSRMHVVRETEDWTAELVCAMVASVQRPPFYLPKKSLGSESVNLTLCLGPSTIPCRIFYLPIDLKAQIEAVIQQARNNKSGGMIRTSFRFGIDEIEVPPIEINDPLDTHSESVTPKFKKCLAVVITKSPCLCIPGSRLSFLDFCMDGSQGTRIALWGTVWEPLSAAELAALQASLVSTKIRRNEGRIDAIREQGHALIVNQLFQSAEHVAAFVGRRVEIHGPPETRVQLDNLTDEETIGDHSSAHTHVLVATGTITGPFGKAGKCRVTLDKDPGLEIWPAVKTELWCHAVLTIRKVRPLISSRSLPNTTGRSNDGGAVGSVCGGQGSQTKQRPGSGVPRLR